MTELSHIYTEDMPILGWSNGQTSLGRLMVLGEAPPPDLCGQPPSMVGAEAVALGIGSWQEDVGFCPQVDVSIWRTRPGTVYLDYVFTSTCLP